VIPNRIRERPWWEAAVIYQVYPRSFQDSDGDGIGDLPGIAGRLDYLAEMGVDAIWLSPIFRSPMRDFGYDISDYQAVDPIFGDLTDLDDLIQGAHRRGLRILLDYVPNHTSSDHVWFRESRSSRTHPRRDWYLWADPASDGGPPNNWLSMFGGSGWEWDETTGQYYFHAFLREQPDLNWRNPAVRSAMYDVLRFWLDRGVDGFRVDVMWLLVKDDEHRDNPPDPAWRPTDRRTYDSLMPVYTADRPEVQDIVAEMRAVLDEYGDRVLVAEIYLPVERLVRYYGAHPVRGAHLPFNFQLLELPWDAEQIGAAVTAYEALLPPAAWPNWVLGNHDRPRIASRLGEAQARVAAMLLLTLRGTPTLYYGDEIAMADVEIPEELRQDPARHDGPGRGRDPQRTPMRWDASRNAGFTTGVPWLPVGPDVERINVASRLAEQGSILHLCRDLLRMRRAEAAFNIGAWSLVTAAGKLLAYERWIDSSRFVVALNLGHETLDAALPVIPGDEVVLSTHLDRSGPVSSEADGSIRLRPDEGIIVRSDGRS
jgi:alpha-glucosidase